LIGRGRSWKRSNPVAPSPEGKRRKMQRKAI
jgi:hypothetical protein